jgi:hypothetical protein
MVEQNWPSQDFQNVTGRPILPILILNNVITYRCSLLGQGWDIFFYSII